METAAALAIVDGALTALEKLAPVIAQLAQAGQINAQTQQALQARIQALRSHDAFSGPEWQVEPK